MQAPFRLPRRNQLPRRYQVALAALYREHGVGRTVDQRLAYWESTCPDGYFMSHDPEDALKVRLFEVSWLSDQPRFMAEFPAC